MSTVVVLLVTGLAITVVTRFVVSIAWNRELITTSRQKTVITTVGTAFTLIFLIPAVGLLLFGLLQLLGVVGAN